MTRVTSVPWIQVSVISLSISNINGKLIQIINYDNRELYYSFDNNRKFLDYIDHRCNKLKRKVHRPYDSNAFKTRRFLKVT